VFEHRVEEFARFLGLRSASSPIEPFSPAKSTVTCLRLPSDVSLCKGRDDAKGDYRGSADAVKY